MASNNSKPAITCRNLTKDYGEGNAQVKALRGVDLDVFPGELTLLVGPSGCGKTTLLSVIAGILEPTAGDLQVLGKDMGKFTQSQKVKFRRDNVGFVFQQFNLLPSLTAVENVTIPLLLSGWSRRKALDAAAPLLEKMGMGPRLHSLPSKLSGGQQQRVAIARALVHHPRLLVCDEPTSSLDANTGHTIMELLRSSAIEGDRAVIIVTHDSRVYGFGDRIAHMNDGSITQVETQVASDARVEDLPPAASAFESVRFDPEVAHTLIIRSIAMITKYVLPLVAFLLLVFAVKHVVDARKPDIPSAPPMDPPKAAFDDNVAGAGMIEAQTENIEVGSPLPGIITEVAVKVSQKVETGDELFRLDDRQLKAELKFRKAAALQADADLKRLENQPRPEQLQINRAQVAEANARLADARDQYSRGRQLSERKAITAEEMFQREQNFRATEAQLERATAEYDLQKAGAWEYDLLVSKAALEQAQTQVVETETQIERLVIRALVQGKVLQVNVRPGEFVGAPANKALIVLGSVQQLHVRVDISEYDISRFNPEAAAVAMPKGQPQIKYPLKLVRIEPYVVPKKSLTGENTERVDTRVLQVIYSMESSVKNLYVGQQLDVYIQADEAMLKPQAGKIKSTKAVVDSEKR